MPFSLRAKYVARAIVKIFETSSPLGDYAAVAVLDDGAGISYGISQFTHRSGSLAYVIEEYLRLGGTEAQSYMLAVLPGLKNTSRKSIESYQKNEQLKKMLKQLGANPLMREAQINIMEREYLEPSIKICRGSNFVLPLSLAVVYDSKNHGSYEEIRDRVIIPINKYLTTLAYEKDWIATYVNARDRWLESIPRLKKTDYRTDFFKEQIKNNNWQLNLPIRVNGHLLAEEMLGLPAEPLNAPRNQIIKPTTSAVIVQSPPLSATDVPLESGASPVNPAQASVSPPALSTTSTPVEKEAIDSEFSCAPIFSSESVASNSAAEAEAESTSTNLTSEKEKQQMENVLLKQFIFQILRHFITAAGGYLVAKNILAQSAVDQMAPHFVELVGGFLLVLSSVLWGFAKTRWNTYFAQAALNADPASATIEQIKQQVKQKSFVAPV